MKTFVIRLTFPSGLMLTPLLVKTENEAKARDAIEKASFFETGSIVEIREKPVEEIEWMFGTLAENQVYQPPLTEWSKD